MNLQSLDNRAKDTLAELIASITAQALDPRNYVYWIKQTGKRSFFSQS